MARYVDGFVLPVARDKLEDYRAVSRKAGEVWLEHGALEYRECVGEDMAIEGMRPFPELAGAGPGEVVIFSWIAYESREHRDEVNARVMSDPRVKDMSPESMPFDCARMAYGGFETIVEM